MLCKSGSFFSHEENKQFVFCLKIRGKCACIVDGRTKKNGSKKNHKINYDEKWKIAKNYEINVCVMCFIL